MMLFAKAPVPGRVKTRLAGEVGAAVAAELHRAFVADTLEKLRHFRDLADVELHTDIKTDAWDNFGVPRSLQIEGGLELRLLHALAQALDAGRPQAMILGSDSPTLPEAHLHQLLQSQADVALGPCRDGGYYAISCRRTHQQMFEGVQWSTPDALEQTERAARACDLSIERGAWWYDVDSHQDLMALAAEPKLPSYTARALMAAGLLESKKAF